MSETIVGTQQVLGQLGVLEMEIQRLRELVRSLTDSPTREKTDHPHVERVSEVLGGEPVIRGTRTPVRAIVEHWQFGDSPNAIARQLPHLRLAQIFDALSYYDDHREEVERYIALNRIPADD